MKAALQFEVPGQSRREAFASALQQGIFLRSLFASLVIWLLMASAMPSYSRLVFQGQLEGYFAAGLAMVLVSQIVVLLISSLFSSDHATLVVPQSPTAVIQGLIVSNVVAAAPADMPPDALFAAALVVIALSALLTGGFLLLLGWLRAGGFIRYIPYPIVGGFMAGLGWLILNAGFDILVGLRLNAQALPTLLEGALLLRWLPAAVFALCILGLRARVQSALVLPGCILAFFSLFHAWVLLGPGDSSSYASAGWFLPELSGGLRWELPDFSVVAQLDLPMLAASAGGILTLIVVCTLNLFLRASAQELVVDRELDFNREFRVNGAANMASGIAGGGIIAYHAPISSALVHSMRVYGRLVGLLLAVLFFFTLFFGSALFSLVPRFIPAGLLIYFGLQFMKQWLLDSWSSLPRREYIVVLVIALVTAFFGLLPAIAVGLVLAITFFVLEYSRMEVIKQEFAGDFHRSNLDRSFAQNQLLQREGRQIRILRLQGFIFFGTAYRIYEHIKQRMEAGDAAPIRYLILDFKAVRGFDFSTIQDFKKLKRLSERHGVALLLSNVAPQLQPLLQQGGLGAGMPGAPARFRDLDHALEWCENALLVAAGAQGSAQLSLEQQLAQQTMFDSLDVQALRRYLQRMRTQVGDTVFDQGDEADALYFVESGRVDVLLRLPDGGDLRLRSMSAGAVIGEVGFYLKKSRTAAVIVTEAGSLQRLGHAALQRMEAAHPQMASAIHILIASALADRLSASNRVIQELLD